MEVGVSSSCRRIISISIVIVVAIPLFKHPYKLPHHSFKFKAVFDMPHHNLLPHTASPRPRLPPPPAARPDGQGRRPQGREEYGETHTHGPAHHHHPGSEDRSQVRVAASCVRIFWVVWVLSCSWVLLLALLCIPLTLLQSRVGGRLERDGREVAVEG